MNFLSSLILLGASALTSMAASITLDASSFPAGNYIFDLQFINGDQVNGNNTAVVSGFLTSGLTLTSLQTFGTVTGTNLATGLTLTDGPITEVQEAFTASGAPWTVGFNVAYSGNYLGPGPGDAFTFTVTDTSLNPINSSGDGSLLEVDITGANSPLMTFAADPAFGSIQPQVVSSPVPEPPAFALILIALILAAVPSRICDRCEVFSVARSERS
jgi:hypothetical protein